MITNLPTDAVFTSVKKFGTLRYCRDPLSIIQQQLQSDTDHAAQTDASFANFISAQPVHVKRLLGTLQADEVDAHFWIDALNNNSVKFTADSS